MKVYGDLVSGNCYKVKLVLALLQIPHEWIHINILNKETHTQDFLLKNANGKVPLLELEDGRCLSESNAIINYLANDSHLIPLDPYLFGLLQQWQFFEQYSHEPYIAVARFIAKYLGLPSERKAEYLSKHEGGYKALKIMDEQLSRTTFLIGEQCTTADISLYAYTHVAHEGGFELTRFKNINRWLSQIEALPHFYSMPRAA